MKTLWLSIPLAFLCELSTEAMAFPEWSQPLASVPEFVPLAAMDYNFEGIVALSNCSGSLIRFDDSQDTDRALVLSNGHCTGMISPGGVIVNQAGTRSFSLLNAKAKKIGSVVSTRLIYATMTGSDISLYELKDSYSAIRTRFNIEALTLSRETPEVGNAIEVISGYWKRGYACQIEKIVDTLLEGKWTFKSSLRYSPIGCETIGGTSGSPVLAAGTRTVIGVNNTGNESGRKCEVNNPCEVEKDGTIIYKKGLSYAQQTFWIYSCRNDAGQLDLNREGCLLAKPKNLVPIVHN